MFWYQLGTVVFFIGLLTFLINWSFKLKDKNE